MLHQVKLSADQIRDIAKSENMAPPDTLEELVAFGDNIRSTLSEWILANSCDLSYVSPFSSTHGVWITFLDPDDAMRFKLTWA